MTTEIKVSQPDSTTSVDLWKFFEERGSKLKESMFQVVTWNLGLASAVLGFAVTKGFEEGLKSIAHPQVLVSMGLIGLALLVHAVIVVRDYGRHINRTFARADAARDGESSPRNIWNAARGAESQQLPPVCWHLLIVVGLFAAAFAIIVVLGLCTGLQSQPPIAQPVAAGDAPKAARP